MNRRAKTTGIPILIALFLFVFIAFALLYGFLDSADPSSVNRLSSSGEGGSSQGGSSSSSEDSYSGGAPEGGYSNYDESRYDIVHMSPSDISKGNLILINHNHSYEIPDDIDLVLLEEHSTESYMVTGEDLLLASHIVAPLNEMMDAFFEETGRNTVSVISAFRSYDRQREIYDEYVELVGPDEARMWAALPGHSEHHAGLAIDFGFYQYGVVRTFLGVGVNAWFRENSHNFGFVLRYDYPKSHITFTAYEPWHFRYVGLPHSHFMFNNDLALEEYVDFIAQHTADEPYRAMFGDVLYEVFFTSDTSIGVPWDLEADISGNNIDGFIVTVRQ